MDKEVKELFLLKCRICGSEDVEIVPIDCGGEVLIYCGDCDNQKEI